MGTVFKKKTKAKTKKPKQKIMKKALIGTLAAGMMVVLASCGGGGHNCDAYNKADYTKYKADQSKKVELNIRKK